MASVVVGGMVRREVAPEEVVGAARGLEGGGFDEVWVVEDCFFAGGIAVAGAVLAATERVRVGIGILPAVLRNPALTAMELGALARMWPGRLVAGIGHGVGAWMEQVGARPPSRLAALEETLEVVRALLAGQRVTRHGRHVHLDEVALDWPPGQAPPVLAGVVGPRSVEVAARAADGMVLPEGSPPAFVADVRARLGPAARLVVYVWAAPTLDAVRAAAEGESLADASDARRPFFADGDLLPQIAVTDAAGIATFADAGADTVVLVPPPDQLLALESFDLGR